MKAERNSWAKGITGLHPSGLPRDLRENPGSFFVLSASFAHRSDKVQYEQAVLQGPFRV